MALSNVDPHALVAAKIATNLTGDQFRYVTLNESSELELCASGAAGYVLVEDGAVGDFGTIVVGTERQKVLCKGAIKVGDLLMADSTGEAIKATTGKYILGIAREEGTSGAVIESLTVPPVTKA
jgi:hypothetical protein